MLNTNSSEYIVMFHVYLSVSVQRTILPRGSYKFTTRKKLSTQVSVCEVRPQFELSLSELTL